MAINRWIASWGPGSFESATANPRLVLLLHGFGSSPEDLAGLGRYFDEDIAWVALEAPLASPYGGSAWFPISTPGTPDPKPVYDSTRDILDWLEGHIPRDAAVIPAGFSQGGLMASQLLRTEPLDFAAIAILSGFVLQGTEPLDEQLRAELPLAFYARGDADTVIAPHAIERTLRWLPDHTAATIKTYPGLAHSVAPQEIDDLNTFLREAFELASKPKAT